MRNVGQMTIGKRHHRLACGGTWNAKIVESFLAILKKGHLWFITIFLGTAIKTNATKLLNDLRITRQNLLATFIDEVAKPEQVFVSNKNHTKPINRPILPIF